MLKSLIAFIIVSASFCFAQSKTETALNFGLRAADTAQTCYHLVKYPHYKWHEDFLPTQSCGGVVAIEGTFAGGSFLLDRFLIAKHHERWAHFQLVSAGGSGIGIAYTFWPRRKK